jgi:hypothetical protein
VPRAAGRSPATGSLANPISRVIDRGPSTDISSDRGGRLSDGIDDRHGMNDTSLTTEPSPGPVARAKERRAAPGKTPSRTLVESPLCSMCANQVANRFRSRPGQGVSKWFGEPISSACFVIHDNNLQTYHLYLLLCSAFREHRPYSGPFLKCGHE